MKYGHVNGFYIDMLIKNVFFPNAVCEMVVKRPQYMIKPLLRGNVEEIQHDIAHFSYEIAFSDMMFLRFLKKCIIFGLD